MPRYIDIDAIPESASAIDKKGRMFVAWSTLNEMPVYDIVHAKWISKYGVFGDWYCSNCEGVLLYEVENYGGSYHDIKTVWSTYCPHCGAKMDLE